MDFIYQLDGMSKAPGNLKVQFHNADGDIEFTPAALHIDGKIGVSETIFADAFEYLQSRRATRRRRSSRSPRRAWSTTAAAAPPSTSRVYPDMDEFWDDLTSAYAEEVRRLGELGCRYLQFDDTSLAYLNDPKQREMIAAQGSSDVEHLHEAYISHINEALAQRPEGMAVTTHMCRGNFRSSWVAEGGYDFVAEALFGQLEVDGFFMEWDDARSGGFEPLRFVPKGKVVVLGLVTTKSRRARVQGRAQAPDRGGVAVRRRRPAVPVAAVRLLLDRGGQRAHARPAGGEAAAHRGDRPGGVGLMRNLAMTVAVAALLALAGCGDDGDSSAAKEEGGVTKVKVGVLPISNVAPLYLGMKKGFFKEEGLEVEPSIGQSGNELVTGMVSGSTDFAFLGYVPLMSARSQGLPVKVVANADNGAETEEKEWTLILTKKGSPIKQPADLAGKTIAVNALKGVRRGRDQGRAREARRRPELDQAARDPVP